MEYSYSIVTFRDKKVLTSINRSAIRFISTEDNAYEAFQSSIAKAIFKVFSPFFFECADTRKFFKNGR